MNAARRKLLADILDRLSSIKAEIEERGEKIQANVEIMDDGVVGIDDPK